MARRIKFPLEMKDGEQVRDIEALREHFDMECVMGYFLNGKLAKWLKDWFYDKEAEQVETLKETDEDLQEKLCKILTVNPQKTTKTDNVDTIKKRNERIEQLKQHTSDLDIIKKVDSVAFTQEDLAILLHNGIKEIYLCGNQFIIPLVDMHIKYIGIGKNVIAVIESKEPVDFDALGIKFDNIVFDEAYTRMKNNNSAISIKVGYKNDNKNSTPWYQSIDFLSEYIYLLLHTAQLPNLGKLATSCGFFFDDTLINPSVFRRNRLLDDTTEILICELADEKSAIAFTNVAFYSEVFAGTKKRIPYSNIRTVSCHVIDGEFILDILYVPDSFYRVFCKHLGNPIAIKLFLKIAAGMKEFTLTEEDFLNNKDIKITSLGKHTIGELIQV